MYSKNKTAHLRVRLTSAEKSAIERCAGSQGISASAFVRARLFSEFPNGYEPTINALLEKVTGNSTAEQIKR